jgi:hypothetical protein
MRRHMVVGRPTAFPNFEHRAWVSWVEQITLYKYPIHAQEMRRHDPLAPGSPPGGMSRRRSLGQGESPFKETVTCEEPAQYLLIF